MLRYEMELSVGDVIRIGDHTIAVVELHNDEVTLKICDEVDADVATENRPAPRPK